VDASPLLGLLALAALVVANAFFVATEFTMVASRRSRLEQLAAEGNPTARVGLHLVSNLDTYIAATQLGVTMASLALGWIGEPALAGLVEPPLESLLGGLAPAAAHAIAVAVSFGFVTIVTIVFGEVVPKRLALQRPEGLLLLAARPLRVFELVLRWPIALINGLSNGVLRLLGLPSASASERVHSVEELRMMVSGSREAGVVEESEARIANRAFTLADHTAGALMTPRTEVDAVPVTVTLPALIEQVTRSPHSRLLVYEGSLDHPVGVLHVHDLFQAIQQHAEPFDVRQIIRPAMVVPESKRADDLLDEMRAARQQFAVVLEEYGGTAGIITLENLLEALVGPIEEEAPVGAAGATGPAPGPLGQAEPDGSILFDGLTRLDDWQEETGLRLDESDRDAAETLGGLVMNRLERIPEVGDEAHVAGRTLRVEELDGRRVAAVRLLPVEAANGTPA